MSKKRNLFNYLISVVGIIVFTSLINYIYIHYFDGIRPGSGMFSITDYTWKYFIVLIITVLMGMVFGIEHLIRNARMDGKWELEIAKLLIIGLPMLLLSIEFFYLHFLNLLNSAIWNIVPYREAFFRFMLGYVIITSLHKKTDDGQK